MLSSAETVLANRIDDAALEEVVVVLLGTTRPNDDDKLLSAVFVDDVVDTGLHQDLNANDEIIIMEYLLKHCLTSSLSLFPSLSRFG